MGNDRGIDLGLLERLSPRDSIFTALENEKIINNIVGFIPASDSCDCAILLSNLAVSMANRDYTVCIVDHKVFYPNLYKIMDCEAHRPGRGLLTMLRSDKVDYREELISTWHKNIYLLSPSPLDAIEDYFDFQSADIERVLSILKEAFDVVLVDIPNMPPLEFCYASVKHCNLGFFVWSERIECPQNTSRFLDFAASLGLNTSKFTNIIINNQTGFSYDYSIIDEMDMKLTAQVPFVPKSYDCALDGKVYIQHTRLIDKRYDTALKKISDMILT